MQKAEAEQRRINEAAAKIQHAWRSLKKARAASETKATKKVSFNRLQVVYDQARGMGSSFQGLAQYCDNCTSRAKTLFLLKVDSCPPLFECQCLRVNGLRMVHELSIGD
jgi:hypothetical protein